MWDCMLVVMLWVWGWFGRRICCELIWLLLCIVVYCYAWGFLCFASVVDAGLDLLPVWRFGCLCPCGFVWVVNR